jgi:hypothetical protein
MLESLSSEGVEDGHGGRAMREAPIGPVALSIARAAPDVMPMASDADASGH